MYAIDLLTAWDNYQAHIEALTEQGVFRPDQLIQKEAKDLFRSVIYRTTKAKSALLGSAYSDDAIIIEPGLAFCIVHQGRTLVSLDGPIMVSPSALIGDYTFGIAPPGETVYMLWDRIDGKTIYQVTNNLEFLTQLTDQI